VSADALLAFARDQQVSRHHPYPLLTGNATPDDSSRAMGL
jgi:hypothetical protein